MLLFKMIASPANAAENEAREPQWQNLECEEGHKYLFSETTHYTWNEAVAECDLYGGWLVNIKDWREQNCLVRYGVSQGFPRCFWTDGNKDLTGVWVHASTGEDMGYFSHKWDCSYETDVVHYGGDAFELCFNGDLLGAWCDISKANIRNIICKALMKMMLSIMVAMPLSYVLMETFWVL